MLKVEVETLSPIKRRVAIEVPREQVSEEMERAYSGLQRRAQVPGFRPGRAPRVVLERQFGARVRGEVFGKLIQESFAEALREQQIQAIGQPEIITEQAEPGASLRFNATVEVYPEVEARDYAGLALERVVPPVRDEDVERQLVSLQESLAQLRPVEGRSAVEGGDVALIDYEARLDDKLIGRAENRQYEVGGGGLPEAFDARLLGASVGDVLDFPVVYPSDDRNPDLSGKTVAFHVVVRGLSLKELPHLDDEFAKDHGECATLAELRDRVRKQLEAVVLRRADDELRGRAMSALVAAHDFEIPDAMVARQTEEMMIEVAESWRARRIWPKDEAAAFDSLRKDLTPRAREQVKGTLILDAVTRQEHIEVTDQEIDAEIERAASASGEGAERIRSLSARPEARDNLRQRLARQRAMDFVVSRADVTTLERPRESVAGEEETR